ncbi:MAG: hypothetical protein JWR16_2929 [Nevskia sp.]|nr:hypothetical protein [Nevskia sp.]
MKDVNIITSLDDDGVLLASIDMPGRSMNVFSASMMDSLEALLDFVESNAAVNAVVLTSGKQAFLAGADLEMIRQYTEAARTDSAVQLHQLCGHLGRLFRRLEKSRKPYVAAINGLALGGGLELSMACHVRVAADDDAVQLGLPEVKLGLLPGAGGTQRLPRLIGAQAGLRMLLLGSSVDARRALELKLVDHLVDRTQLIATAKDIARNASLSPPQAPWDKPGSTFSEAPYDFAQAKVFTTILQAVGVSAQQRARYPAYEAILSCVIGGWTRSFDEAFRWEMDCFVKLIQDRVAGNMVRALFLNRQKAQKLGLLGPESEFGRGAGALLPRLRSAAREARELAVSDDDLLLAVALAAISVWSSGSIAEPELADAAVVAEGLHPAYTGGPLNYALQCGAGELRTRAIAAQTHSAGLFALPSGFDEFFATAQLAAA